jgi:hypothetical protein
MKHMKQNGQGGLLKVRDHQFDLFIQVLSKHLPSQQFQELKEKNKQIIF